MKLSTACKRGFINEVQKQMNLITINKELHLSMALQQACAYNKIDVAKLLLKNGATLTRNNNRELNDACSKGNLELVTFLLSNGAVPDDLTLKLSCTKGNLDIVKLLIQYGADLSANNYSAIYLAQTYNQIHIADYLNKLLLINKLHDLHPS